MFNLEFINNLLFYFLIPFLFYIVYLDVKYKKINNQYNLLIFILSIIFLLLNIFTFNLYKLIVIFLVILIAFILYSKGVWGAGDGKLFISLSIILISALDYYEELNFLLNIVSFYSIVLIFLVLFKLDFKEKKRVFKKIDFYYESIIILSLFLFLSILYLIFNRFYSNIYFLFGLFVFVFIFMYLYRLKLKKFLKRYSIEDKLIIISLLFLAFLIIGKGKFLVFYFSVFLIKVFILFFSEGAKIIEIKKNYSTPFAFFLIISFIFTFISKSNILIILIFLIKNLI